MPPSVGDALIAAQSPFLDSYIFMIDIIHFSFVESCACWHCLAGSTIGDIC